MATSLTFQVKSKGSLDAVIAGIPATLSMALNDSLFRTRDQLAKEAYVKEQEVRGVGGRRLRAQQRRAVGRSVFRVDKSDEQNLTGDISINIPTPETRAQRFANLSLPDLIRGFASSTYPRFVGKSRKERIRMALAVYYRAKRGLAFQETVAGRAAQYGAINRSPLEQKKGLFSEPFNDFMIEAAEKNFLSRTRQLVRASNTQKSA